MSYSSSDVRVALRETIGTERYIYREDRWVITCNDNFGDPVYVPLLLPSEVRGGDLPPFPFVEINLMGSPASNMNIGGDVREMDVYLDFNIYCVENSSITPDVFLKTVSDTIIDRVTDERNQVSGSYYVEVINDGREIIEQEEGKSVVYRRVLELHIKNFS
jgi:hypothetical protein